MCFTWWRISSEAEAPRDATITRWLPHQLADEPDMYGFATPATNIKRSLPREFHPSNVFHQISFSLELSENSDGLGVRAKEAALCPSGYQAARCDASESTAVANIRARVLCWAFSCTTRSCTTDSAHVAISSVRLSLQTQDYQDKDSNSTNRITRLAQSKRSL